MRRISYRGLSGLAMFAFCFARANAQAPAPAASASVSSPLATCAADQISAGIDTENGAFDAMNQSGALLVLRNVSAFACRIEPVAHLAFFDANRKALDVTIERDSPFAGPIVNGGRLPMGHGPVVLPLVLAAGAEATATLHWVAGDVYEHSVCVTTAFVRVDVAGKPAQTTLQAHVCAPDTTQLHVRTTGLALDPHAP